MAVCVQRLLNYSKGRVSGWSLILVSKVSQIQSPCKMYKSSSWHWKEIHWIHTLLRLLGGAECICWQVMRKFHKEMPQRTFMMLVQKAPVIEARSSLPLIFLEGERILEIWRVECLSSHIFCMPLGRNAMPRVNEWQTHCIREMTSRRSFNLSEHSPSLGRAACDLHTRIIPNWIILVMQRSNLKCILRIALEDFSVDPWQCLVKDKAVVALEGEVHKPLGTLMQLFLLHSC